MSDTKATKLEAPNASKPAEKPPDAVGVFTKDHYCAFGCFRAGQHITRKRGGEHWQSWVRDGLVRVL